MFVSVTSYNNAQTPATSCLNCTVSRFKSCINALNFSTELIFNPDGFFWITEKVEKKDWANLAHGIFLKSSNESNQEISVFDVLGRKLYNLPSIYLTVFKQTSLLLNANFIETKNSMFKKRIY